MNILTQNEILIVSKYFNKINDYINIIKTCKEYNNILNLLYYNPIPFNERIYKYFKNIQTLHLYSLHDFEDINIPKIIWYNVNYETYKNNETNIYKNIEICQNDINKYGVDILNEKINIVEIDNNCFNDCNNINLKELIIPNSITKIGKYCFWMFQFNRT